MISWPIAASLALSAAQQPVVTGGLETMVKLAIGIDEALGEFERLCLARPFDAASFEKAVRGSSWRYRRAADSEPELIGYDSRKGYASIKWLGPPAGRLPQCNLDAATLRPYTPTATAARIEARLKRLLGTIPVRQASGTSLFWEWPAETGKAVRLYLLRHPGSDPRQLTLTLQKWPQAESSPTTTGRNRPALEEATQ
ncbi:MAG TPA: hypothetical protein VEA61_14030 [Allosphingosinicella sp.]|nr:hypothetical protein [Allosphingosinicella sp.]